MVKSVASSFNQRFCLGYIFVTSDQVYYYSRVCEEKTKPIDDRTESGFLQYLHRGLKSTNLHKSTTLEKKQGPATKKQDRRLRHLSTKVTFHFIKKKYHTTNLK